MKKVIVSGALIAIFLIYTISQRQQQQAADAATVAALNASATPPIAATSTPTDTPTPATTSAGSDSTPTPTATPAPTPSGQYKDGSYTGTAADAFYGNIQVKAIISGGKLTNVQFLQYPNDRRESIQINTQAMPLLRQEAITAQSANIDGVSGASDSSQAFVQSLSSALSQAKN